MTSEEIKATTSMTDVLTKYGIRVDRRMCSCPFHGADKHPSMQVFQDGFKCYTCGAYGDIFSFVMKYERCSFADAFRILGGRYEHSNSRSSRVIAAKREAERKTREAQANRLRQRKELNNNLISAYRWGLEHNPPMSDAWAECMHKLTYQLHVHEELNG